MFLRGGRGGRGDRRSAGLIALAVLLSPALSPAHELRPAMLRVDLVAPTDDSGDVLVELHLRLPPQVSSAFAAKIQPRLPPTCTLGAPEVTAQRRSWRGRCEGGAPLGALTLEGLGRGLEVVVDLRRTGGRSGVPATTAVLHGSAASLSLGTGRDAGAGPRSGAATASGYLGLGVEHIFAGLDHLFFVVGLVLLGTRSPAGEAGSVQIAGSWGGLPSQAQLRLRLRLRLLLRVLGLLTAFTVAHSLTLAAAALGWLRLPPAPVEACIALSIVLLAREVVRSEPQMSSPWGFAFACGLLHGLGFAGALAQIGLPSESIVSGLLLFNLGVELGQVAVALATLVGLLGLLGLGAPRLGASADRAVRIVLGTALGSLAVAWTLDRALSMVR